MGLVLCFISATLLHVMQGQSLGPCSTSVPCSDPAASCNLLGLCECSKGYTAFEGACHADGDLHGTCSTKINCVEANTECDTKTTKKSQLYMGSCNTTSQCSDPGAQCDMAAEQCMENYMEDVLLQFLVSTPILLVTMFPVNANARQVGVLGGACSLTSACTTTNTECGSSGLCVCRSGYSQSSDNCKQDGTLHGACSGFVACADSNTECSLVSGTCQCATGFLEESGKCVETQLYLGSCNTTSPCSDPGAKCDMAAEQCVCKDGHTAFSSSDICWQDGTLNGTCFDATGPTCTVTHTTCHSTLQRCTCDNDYTPYDGKCRAVGVLDGACSLSSECTTTNTECGSSGLCVCRSGYSPNSGNCIQVGAIGSSCTVASNCLTNNSECGIAGLCMSMPSVVLKKFAPAQTDTKKAEVSVKKMEFQHEEAKAPLPEEYMLDKTDATPYRKPKLSALNATPREPLDITAIRRDAPAPLPAIRPLNGGATVPHVNHAPIVAQRPRDVYRGRRLLENEEMEAGLYKQKQRGDFNEYQPYKPWEKTPEKYNIAPNSSRKAKGHGRKNVHKAGGETVEEMEEKYQRRLRKLQRAKMRLLTALTLKSKQTNEKKNKKYESDDFEVSDAGTPDDSDEITEEQELERFKEKHWQKRRRMLGKARVGIMDTDRDGAPPYYVSGGGLNQYFYTPGRQQSRDITPHYVPDYEHLRGLTPNVYAPYGQMHMGNQN
ncbi:hypothetical protein MAR_018878 [Mya arenaria]|uniref:EGF-like domain-containing protein n=1 Tax=Mya arenaria TaxID=6604 RepID=A0ABY7EIF8_MYAAR|nr:hypothetical protein MAR_018878 [Mya arenaria]